MSDVKLAVEDFTNHPTVQECLTQLRKKFNENNPLIVSDVLDRDNHQYVNLVQKGGGVLGIALVGYTYILEQMGIRFIRLAGTSAGAINTAFMTVTGNSKADAKSEFVLQEICDLDFFSLVDGPPAARAIIKHFITNKNFTGKIKKWIAGILLTLFILLTGDFIFLSLQHTLPRVAVLTRLFFALTALLFLLIIFLTVYVSSLLKRLKNAGFGINPGDVFYDWIKKRLIHYGVVTVTDLCSKASLPVPGLHLRPGVTNTEELNGLAGDVTFITSELVTRNKIQFPEMWKYFRKDINALQPAGFIRASMSIPVFFESYFIEDIPCTDPAIQKLWLDNLNENNPPSTARFVDGGILSNFPISIFFNPKIQIPRLPSFGIDLDDNLPANYIRTDGVKNGKANEITDKKINNKKVDDAGHHAASWTLSGYFIRMLNTIRGYYDKDFLLKNKVFRKGIGIVPLGGYNWLNFFLQKEDKINMFLCGARAAQEFLEKFNWDEYKNARNEMMQQMQSEMPESGNREHLKTIIEKENQ